MKLRYEEYQVEYQERYSRFITHTKRIWINVLINRETKNLLKRQYEQQTLNNEYVIRNEESPVGSKNKPINLKGKDLLEFMDSSTGGGSEWVLEWSLVSAIGLFEVFISDIAKIAYLTYPDRYLLSKEDITNEQENYKVIKLLIHSRTKEEALEKYVEEKLRDIFYGKITDAFFIKQKNGKTTNGKLKLNTGKMAETCRLEFNQYLEINGRRNLITHNQGKVDNKYIREVPDNIQENSNNVIIKLHAGDKAKISEEYLFNALKILDKLAFEYTQIVLDSTKK